MADRYGVEVLNEVRDDLRERLAFIADTYGSVYAERVGQRLAQAVDSLAYMPTQHMRLRRQRPGAFEYRRLLIGSYRIIFRIDESASVVVVVEIDTGRSDPRRLEELP